MAISVKLHLRRKCKKKEEKRERDSVAEGPATVWLFITSPELLLCNH